MFEFFKKGKNKKKTDISFLEKVLLKLPEEYGELLKQFKDGLIKDTFYQSAPVKNYVGFSYNPIKSKEFENKKGRSFMVKGVKILNNVDNKTTDLDIYVAHGLIAGYSTPGTESFIADTNSISYENLYKTYLEDFSQNELANIFTESQIKLINPSEIYEVELEGKIYYHLQDLEDGDFIAMGIDHKIYKITHDPFEIVLIEEDLSEVLKS
jgi:hypothetical protein